MQNRVQKALDYVRSRSAGIPEAAVVLGSGLGAFADALEDRTVIPYGISPAGRRPRPRGTQEGLSLAKLRRNTLRSCRDGFIITRGIPWRTWSSPCGSSRPWA